MAFTYIASQLELQKEKDLYPDFGPTLHTEEWRGSPLQIAAKAATLTRGNAYAGGYLVDFEVEEGDGPYDTLYIKVLLAPSFTAYLAVNSRGIKTASISADVDSAATWESIAGEAPTDDTIVSVNRDVTYYAPQTTYHYFASSQPTGARFTAVAAGAIRAIRGRLTAQAGGRTKVYGGNAPAAIVSATNMPEAASLVDHTAERIAGTTWWRCTDVVALEYQGD